MSVRGNHQGSSIVIALLVFATVLIVGFVTWFVISQNRNGTSSQVSTGNTGEEAGLQAGDQSSSLLVGYQSIKGGFSLSYPKSWQVTGYKGGQKVDKLSGDEDRLHFQTIADTSAKINNFGADLMLSSTAPGDTAWPTYPNGTVIEKLKNGIDAWEDKQDQTLATGKHENTCPAIRVASNNAFGFQLKNGTWLSFNGSFCWASDMKTSYSYAQQRDSTEFAEAVALLRSIKQE